MTENDTQPQGYWAYSSGDDAHPRQMGPSKWKEKLFGRHICNRHLVRRHYPPQWSRLRFCEVCGRHFNWFRWNLRHHCRNCGRSVCSECCSCFAPLQRFGFYDPVRICQLCVYKLQGCIDVL
eukprot:Platyproteum_vivax@DN4091_c0_g1_i2.p2